MKLILGRRLHFRLLVQDLVTGLAKDTGWMPGYDKCMVGSESSWMNTNC